MDYFTIQQYKAEVTNTQILSSVRSALVKYGYSTTKKVLFNRYQHRVGFSTSSDLIEILKAEKAVIDNADMVYGICYEGDMFNSTMWTDTYQMLHRMKEDRRPFELLPSGIDGFSASSSSRFFAVLWNTGTSKKINLNLKNTPTGLNTKTLTVKIANGSSISNSTTAKWSSSAKTISGFSIPANGYALIELK